MSGPRSQSPAFGGGKRLVRPGRSGLARIAGWPYSEVMTPLKARVQSGRPLLDEPTELPEGTVVDLVADDEGDDLTDPERRALHDALSTSWASVEAGASAAGLGDSGRAASTGVRLPVQTTPEADTRVREIDD